MKFNKNYCKLYKDQFNYYNLMQKIKPSYRLFFNEKEKKFIVVNIDKNYEICKIFNGFLDNLIQDLRFSKIENYNKILNYIDNGNEKLSTKQAQNIKHLSEFAVGEVSKLSNRSNKLNQTDINKIIGATKC